jgi:hypothetical protein
MTYLRKSYLKSILFTIVTLVIEVFNCAALRFINFNQLSINIQQLFYRDKCEL